MMEPWSLQTKVTGNVVHSFTETSTDQAGHTVSSAGVALYTPAANKLLAGGPGNDVLIGSYGGGQKKWVFVESSG